MRKGFGARLSAFVSVFLLSLWLSACGRNAEIEVPALVKQLQSKESSERNRAALRLASYGKSAKAAVPALIERLQDANGGVRSSAAYALREIDTPEAQNALKRYVK